MQGGWGRGLQTETCFAVRAILGPVGDGFGSFEVQKSIFYPKGSIGLMAQESMRCGNVGDAGVEQFI